MANIPAGTPNVKPNPIVGVGHAKGLPNTGALPANKVAAPIVQKANAQALAAGAIKATAGTPSPSPALTKPVAGGTIPATPPAFIIRTKEDREDQRYLKILIYADYGVGKTYLAGTAAAVPAMNDVLMISAESGELTLDTNDGAMGEAFANIDSIGVQNYRAMAKIYEFLKLHCKYRDDNSEAAILRLKQLQAKNTGVAIESITKPRRFRTVIIDSLSEIEAYCMNQLLQIDESTALDEEVAGAEWSEYKKQHGMIQRLVRSYRDLPMNVIFICSRSFMQDESKKMLFSPGLTGKLAGQVQGFMDIVGYYVLGQPKEDGTIPRRLYVQPAGKFQAKSRFSNYKSSYFDDPTMGSILQKVGLLQGSK